MAKRYSVHLNFNHEPVIRLYQDLKKSELRLLRLSEILGMKINFRDRKSVRVTMIKEHDNV